MTRPTTAALNLLAMNDTGKLASGQGSSAPNSSYVMLVSLVVALGGFLMGFDSGVIGGVVEPIREGFILDSGQVGWAVACLTLGATLAMAVAGPLADRFGRRPVLMVTALLFTLSAAGSAWAPTYDLLVWARILGGFGVGGALLIAPMYIAEIAPPEQRGKLVSFNQLNIVLGFSASFFSNYFINDAISEDGAVTVDNAWRIMLGVETIPAALYLGLLFLVPRSPRWLASRGREDEARSVLQRTAGEAAAADALAKIQESLAKAAGASRTRLGDLFNSRMARVMMIGLGLGFFQQITGINAIFYYAPTIFEMSGASRDSALFQAIVVGLVNVAFTLLAMRLIDRAGRRPLLLMGTTLMALALFTNAWCFQQATFTLTPEAAQALGEDAAAALATVQGTPFGDQVAFGEAIKAAVAGLPEERVAAITGSIQDLAKGGLSIRGTLVLIAICLFIAGFAISLGPVMWAMFSEIFPQQVRGLAISVAGFFNSAISYLVQQLFPVGMDSLGPAIVFAVFGTFAVLALLFTIFVVPETKGRSLEELEAELVG